MRSEILILVGRQECLFAVKNRRFVAACVIPAIKVQRPQVQLHRPHQPRVRIVLAKTGQVAVSGRSYLLLGL